MLTTLPSRTVFSASSYQCIVNEAVSSARIIFAGSIRNSIYFAALHVGENSGVVFFAHTALEEKRIVGWERIFWHRTLRSCLTDVSVAGVSMDFSLETAVGTGVSHFRGPSEVPVQGVNLHTKTSLSRKFRPMMVAGSLACCVPYSGQTRNTSTVSFLQNESEPDSFIGMIFSKTCVQNRQSG